MDLFDDILKQASTNTKNASKEIEKIDEARQKIKKCMNVRLAAERKQPKVVKSPIEKPKFVIPKKKTKEDPDVDRSRIALYLKKKEEERRKALTQKKKQKEELLKLRLQSYGGKANKKLAKQFGSTAVELQQKYGNNREHEERLKKQQIREQEEAERLSCELRGSVVKALERKKVVEKIAGAESCRNRPYRVAVNKKNSLRHLTKEDSPGPCTSFTSEGKSRKIDSRVAAKRRLPPSEADFFSLMKKAEAIQSGKLSPSPPPPPVPPPAKKISNGLLQREVREIRKDREDKTKSASVSTKKDVTARRSSDATKKINGIHSKEQKMSPSASSGSCFTPPSRRYLPGDIRYQGPAPDRSQTTVKTGGNPSNAAKINMKDSNNKNIQRDSRRTVGNARDLTSGDNRQQDACRQILSRKEAITRFRAYERIKEQRRLEELRQLRDDRLDEDVDDEEYDSEMDDFIDDSEVDEHLKRGDLEETLRLINPRYDKNRWKLRERMIDDRQMEASYRDIAREEKRSSRIGLIEDIREAQRGKSIAL